MEIIKIIIVLLSAISIIPVSIIGMMWGWGIHPQNWGWIAFSYVWMLIPQLISATLKK